MRTIDATLLAALQAGDPKPYIKAYLGYETGAEKASYTKVPFYRLTGTSLEFVITTKANLASDQETIWLERGVTIAGTNYTVTTGRFFITEEEYLDNQHARYKGTLFPPRYYSAAGDVTYEAAIDAFCTEWGKTTTYKDAAEAWLAYQFLPAGQNIVMNHAMRFLNMLQQKRLIRVCDNGAEDVRIYSADVLGASVLTVNLADEYSIHTTKLRSRQYIWRDENETLYQDGELTDPIHNLGYLESTDSPPARNGMTAGIVAYIRPDLRIQDGDTIMINAYGFETSATFFAQVTEEFDPRSTILPKWRVKLESNPIFESTEGGALPSTIERVSNYTPLNTSQFDGLLSDQDNNLQAALETIDDHVRFKLDMATTIYVRKEIGACTISNASPAVVTDAGHGLIDDDAVVFRTSGALPTGLSPGVVYYVNYVDADTYQVAATPDGASINTTGAGSGTHYHATGDDTNDGTAQNKSHALLTLAAAIALVGSWDSDFTVTIQCDDSHYIEGTMTCRNLPGSGSVTVTGNTTTPANCVIDGAFAKATPGTVYTIRGFRLIKVSSSSAFAIQLDAGATFYIGNLTFGTGFTYHILVSNSANCWILAAYTIEAGASRHYSASSHGRITNNASFTVTLTGTPAFSSKFAEATQMGMLGINQAQVTFSGAATGKRYDATLNAVINSNGGGANYFPGNAAGATATGGQYA